MSKDEMAALESGQPKIATGVSFSDWRLDVVLAAAVFLFALLMAALFAGGRYALEPDGARELHMAQNIVGGEGLFSKIIGEDTSVPTDTYFITKPPLYILAIAALIKIGVPAKMAGWSISQVSFSIAAAALFGLGRLTMRTLLAVAIAVLFSLQVSALRLSIYAREDALFMAFTWGSLLLFAYLRAKPWLGSRWWFLLGVVSACSILTRYLGVALLLTVGMIAIHDVVTRRLPATRALWMVFGALVTGIVPLVLFMKLWVEGVRPAFYSGTESTTFNMTAGWLGSLQRDFVGSLLVWLYKQSVFDWIILLAALALLAGILVVMALRNRPLLPVSLFVVLYLLILTVQLGRGGMTYFEARYAVPIEGLLILAVVAPLEAAHIRLKSTLSRLALLGGVVVFVGVFLHGQVLRYHEFNSPWPTGQSREYCYSPKTIDWIKTNIPPRAVIMGTQCTFQLLAESSQYFWIPIPPADEYASSPRYSKRWQESDAVRVSGTTGAKWIVLLNGGREDPLAKNPGYGEFIDGLSDGNEGRYFKVAAVFTDGIVYRLIE